MADMRIDDATLDLDVTGIENLPVSDAGAAKRMTVGQIKDFVLSAIASLSSGSVGDESLFFHSKSGTNYKANLAEVAAKVVDKAFDSASVNTPAASKFLIEDASGTKTISITNLCNYIKDNVALLDIASLTNAGTIGDGDYTILSQGGTNVKATLSSVANYIEGKLGAWINSLSDVGTISGTDKLVVSVNGVSRSVSVSALMSSVQGGFVTGPSTTTENNVPQWDSTTKQLKNGLAVRTSVRAVGTADNSSIATEAAVAAAVGAIDTGVGIDGTTPTTGNIPVWAGATKIASGKTVTTEVRNSVLSSDAAIATEKAVRTAIDTMGATKVDAVSGKGLSTEDYTTAEKAKLNGIATGADVSTITGVQVDGADLVVTNKKVNVVLSGKVDKVTGKGLSTNDYTTAEKTKLSGIAAGADVSTISGVQVDGTDLVVSNKKVNIVLSGKVDKVSGKGLSTNDYTTAEKTKLAGVEAGAQENVQADWNQTNTLADDFIKNKPTIPTMPSVPIQAWAAGKTYAVGDYCVQGGFLQRCIHAGSTQTFNANDWEHIPAYPTTATNSVFLRGDGTWAAPSAASGGVIAEWEANKTYAIGDYCHYNGFVRRCIYAGSSAAFNPSSWENFPAYPSSSQTEKYLRGDGTWVSLPQMGGATTASAGTSGLVPAPSASDSAKFLKGNGSWTAIPTMTGATGLTAGASGLVPAPESTDGTKFLKGDGTWGTPSGMDAMTGATSVLPGSAGTVPAPTAGDDSKFLCGDGTWKSVQGSGGGDVYGPSSTTENAIPQWDSTTKRLKNGVSLNTSVGGTPSDAAVLSEKAVSDTFVRGAGLKIEVVSSVPASPVSNTIYFVTEAS